MAIKVTPLEATLAAMFLSMVSSLVTWAITSSRCMDKTTCNERHKGICDTFAAISAKHENDMRDLREKQSRDSGMILRMLRATIMHLPIDNDTREEIVNDRRSS